MQLVVLSLALNFIIECMSRHSVKGALIFVFKTPWLFVLGALLIMALSSLSLLFKRRYFVLILTFSFWGVLALANFILLFLRITPLSFTDILLLKSVWGIIDMYLNVIHFILIIIFFVGLIVMFIILFRKAKKKPVRLLKGIITAAFLIALSVFSVIMLTNTPVVESGFGNLGDAYESFGFNYCFTVSIFDRGISRPPDYSEELVDEILESIDADYTSNTKFAPNIIFVQLESFIDVNYLKNLTYSENPVPNFTYLKEHCPSAFLSVPSIGAGTANTEFEVLTGMNIDYFGAGEYPYKTILQSSTCESVAFNLKELGYSSHVLHNNTATFYDRNIVFSQLGFDTFTSIEYMTDYVENPIGWAKDECLTDEILSSMRSSEGRDFVYGISVQPHGQYPTTRIDDSQKITISGIEDEMLLNQYEYYINQMYECDRFIGELVSALRGYDEPVILVLYGDHIPNLGIEEEDLSDGNLYQTEYVIWSNYYTRFTAQDLEAYQLSAYVMGLFGFDNGLLTKLHQNYSDNADYQHALDILQYDVLYGEAAAYSGTVPYSPTKLKMGSRPITTTSVELAYGVLRVKGENFTLNSRVYINGKPAETVFLDNGTLIVVDIELAEGDSIIVAQVSDGGVMLSRTESRFFSADGA